MCRQAGIKRKHRSQIFAGCRGTRAGARWTPLALSRTPHMLPPSWYVWCQRGMIKGLTESRSPGHSSMPSVQVVAFLCLSCGILVFYVHLWISPSLPLHRPTLVCQPTSPWLGSYFKAPSRCKGLIAKRSKFTMTNQGQVWGIATIKSKSRDRNFLYSLAKSPCSPEFVPWCVYCVSVGRSQGSSNRIQQPILFANRINAGFKWQIISEND